MSHSIKQIETSEGRYEVQRFGCTVQTRTWLVQPDLPAGGYWDELYYETAANEAEAQSWFGKEVAAVEAI